MIVENESGGVTLATAGKFYTFHLAAEFAKLGVLEKLIVSDRHLLAPDGVPQSAYINRPDLAYWRYAQMLCNVGYSEERKNRIYEEWLARRLLKMRPGVLHVWNGIARTSFKRLAGRGWLRCLERACPHNWVQYTLLSEEADRLGLQYIEGKSDIERAVEELYMADIIAVPSAYSAASYTDPELARKVRVNALGANYPFLQRRDNGGRLRILMVGNDFVRKGVHYLIEGFKLIDDPTAELWIRGPVPADYHPSIKDSRIKVIGGLMPGKLQELYRSATVFVQPSIDEGFGMTVLEALACGLPLVVTENVGALDVLTDEVAITVPIRDPEALARAILAARHLPGAAFDAARRRILERNSWEACAHRMLTDVYREPSLSPIDGTAASGLSDRS